MKTIPIHTAHTAVPPDAPAPDPAWRWRRLLTAPHRLAFFAGALVLGASGLWWLVVMLARSLDVALPWALPPAIGHGLLMGFGFMPLFFAGFLFTAGPNWLSQPPVAAIALRAPVLVKLFGWALFIVGVHAAAWLAATGLALAGAAFAALALRFARLVRTSRSPDRLHPRLILTGCSLGVGLWFAAAASIALDEHAPARAAMLAGLWGFIALVFTTVSHRMVPFFNGSALPRVDARWPSWLLGVMAVAVLVEALLAGAEVLWWPLPVALTAARAAAEAAVAVLLLTQAVHWSRGPYLKQRLLTMLLVGFFWLGLAFALLAASNVWRLLAPRGGGLALAPLHALTAGFFVSTLFATVGRVSAGHSGRAVAADDFAWRVFWLLQVAVVLRLAAELWRAGSPALLALAAIVWAAATLAWALRYGRWYGSPRADGRPG